MSATLLSLLISLREEVKSACITNLYQPRNPGAGAHSSRRSHPLTPTPAAASGSSGKAGSTTASTNPPMHRPFQSLPSHAPFLPRAAVNVLFFWYQ